MSHNAPTRLDVPVLAALLLGHQGGWDEILVVAIPVAVFALLLWVAKRRAERLE